MDDLTPAPYEKKAVSDSGDATCLQIISIHGCNGWNGLGGWMDGWMGGWMSGWMDGWMGGWMDGWMGG